MTCNHTESDDTVTGLLHQPIFLLHQRPVWLNLWVLTCMFVGTSVELLIPTMTRLFCFLLGWVCALGAQAQISPHPKLAEAKARYADALTRHDTMALVEAAYDMGKHYRASGDFVTGRQWLLYVLRYREARGPSVGLNKVLVQLTYNGPLPGNEAEAFGYAYRALSNSRRLGHPHSLMSSYALLGGLHHDLATQQPAPPPQPQRMHLDSAAWYWQQAETIALRLNVPLDIAASRYQRARLLMEPAPQRAIPLLNAALRTYLSLKTAQNIVSLYNDLARCHIRLEQLPEARQHLLRADYHTQHGDHVGLEIRLKTQETWAEWHRAAAHWQPAYTYLHVADSLRQAILSDRQRSTLAQLSVAYATNRREILLQQQQTELALRETRLTAQRTYTYLALSGLIVAVVVGGLFYRLSRRNQRISEQNAYLVREQNHRMKNNLQTVAGLLSLQANRMTDADAKRAMEESQLRLQTMALLNRKLYETGHMVSTDLSVVIPDVVRLVLDSYGYQRIEPTYDIADLPLNADQLVPVVLIMNELTTNACKYAFPDHPTPVL